MSARGSTEFTEVCTAPDSVPYSQPMTGGEMEIDDFHKRVYALGGGVTCSEDDGVQLYAVVSLPGIITKFEPIGDAITRLNDYEKAKS